MDPFLILGIVGIVLVVVGFFADFEIFDIFPAVIIGTFAGVLGWAGFILQSFNTSTPINLTASVLLAGGATWVAKKTMDGLSSLDGGEQVETMQQLVGQTARVIMGETVNEESPLGITEGGGNLNTTFEIEPVKLVKIMTTLDGVPVQLTAENDDHDITLHKGDEVLIFQVVSPTKVLVKSI